MHGKSFNAPELIKEDLLCFYKFSRKGVEFAGDLGIIVSCLSHAFIFSPAHVFPELTLALFFLSFYADERMGKAEMLKAMQEAARASGEAGPPKKTTKKRKVPSSTEEEVQAERRKKSVSTSGTRPEETQERSRVPTPPTAAPEETPAPTQAIPSAEASYICNMAPEPDLPVLVKADDAEVIAHLSAHIAPEARVAEKEAMRAELEEVKARSEQEAERLKGEAREEFLKSPEFDVLLGKRAFSYFKDGFWGCLAQFRANGYSEEEHPASFLDLQQALVKLGDEEEEEEGEQEEEDVGDDAEDKTPPS
ncbi:hypothetical protein F511_22664 [Dorcoceras hygrometricum]|uniref:Uncharacterized protein n=1 Tax=Dorcoceras hygrometricum TaxID=472368 RepID=A0A2Z7C1B0_9LAMI|nr:hypothetical protein F511_22664 [Dorcoceras hygrometricum]